MEPKSKELDPLSSQFPRPCHKPSKDLNIAIFHYMLYEYTVGSCVGGDMKEKSVFEEIVIYKEGSRVGGYDIAGECNIIPSLEACHCNGILLRPVAWSWFYLGVHVTTDKAKAEELLSFGESLQPLYAIVG
ncbi:hypothetical protein [Pseudomonas sp. P7548]|uniref:hypothetical protein n=1 Tax=Pseudomonas sp. P7548 TaxID=2726981 RepID=UPI0015BB9C6E|nr:hypothetical protein [Pseudomonas sp. P7548]NWE18059.1 hypothetical protein [Pseudomonas sp. P7548]